MFLFLILFFFLSFFKPSSCLINIHTGNKSNSTNNTFNSLEGHLFPLIQENNISTAATVLPKWTQWSDWSKCKRCLQKRMRICLSSSCEFVKVYQERYCKKKKCKRKLQYTDDLIVMPEKPNRISLKSNNPTIWSSWSSWSSCSQNCKTYRKRYCKKPGRCKKRRQVQNAYCYNDETRCKNFVNKVISLENWGGNKYPIHKKRGVLDSRVKCGRVNRKTRMLKIIGGSESPKYKWPWHVALINQYAEVFCGGTLVAPKWVLTASHCIRNFLIVRLNEHDLKYTDGRELELFITKVYQYPRFNQKTIDGDIALIQLPMAVKTPVACLPNRQPTPGQLCSVMGWGKVTSRSKYGSTRLRETQVPVIEDEICKWAYKDLLVSENMICAGWASGRADTCAGDSGGGLLCAQNYHRNRRDVYAVQGITSFGKGCGKRNKYGIYTVVYNYLDWIEYIMNRDSSSN